MVCQLIVVLDHAVAPDANARRPSVSRAHLFFCMCKLVAPNNVRLVAGLPIAVPMSTVVALLSSDFVEPNTNGRTKSLTDASPYLRVLGEPTTACKTAASMNVYIIQIPSGLTD